MPRLLYFLLAIAVLTSCRYASSNDETGTESKPVTKYTIEQLYKSSEVFGGAFSLDDSKLLVTSNESGIFNAYEIDITSGNKKQLTSSTGESIFADTYVP